MRKISIKRKIPLFIIIAINILLVVSVMGLMRHVQKLLNSDVEINLMEVVTQNRDVIAGRLRLEVNHLDLVALQISDQLQRSKEIEGDALAKAVGDFFRENPDSAVGVTDGAGVTYFVDGATVDVSGRRYYRLAMAGEQNISDRLISRLNGEEVFIICVPLRYNGDIVGTVQRPYTPQEMYELCAVSLFSSQGYMHIINSEGYIMFTSQTGEAVQEADNYFRNTYARGDQEAARQIEADVQAGRDGFVITEEAGRKIFSAYTPLRKIHDWYLISSVDTAAVSPNANTVIRMFYFILLAVAVIFGASLFYIFYMQSRQSAALERVAFVDTITGGDTYNKFSVDLAAALRQRPDRSYYLLSLDIDNFRYINSYYGFDFGDRILRRIHADIHANLLPGESVARISGDHFIVLLLDACEERMDLFSELTVTEGGVSVYLAAGLYAVTDPNESLNLMVDKATTAAQAAKGSLRRQIVTYSEQFDLTMMQNEQLKRKVEEALINREFVPFYQPKVDMITRALVGAEALARWKMPDGSMVSPAEFIPLCEQTGQIVELDMLIFEQTLEFLAHNLMQGINCTPISVNFSRLHLVEEDFVHKIIDRVKDHNVPPHLIQIELTESIIFDNHEVIIDFVGHLHEHGLLLCIDDFGSGYSSLNMLKDIPVDVLKIDKAFLDDTNNRERQRVILATIADMAERLHIDVVVEGVETQENVALMKEFGCYVAQGYYFARPMDEERFGQVFQEGAVC